MINFLSSIHAFCRRFSLAYRRGNVLLRFASQEYKEAQRNAEDAKDGLAADLMRARAQWQAREALLKKVGAMGL